jgi:hypothetical protein
MALLWTPEPTDPLYNGSESIPQPLIFTVEVSLPPEDTSGETPTIDDVSIPESMPQITVSGIGTSSTTISIPNFNGLYPIEIKIVDFENQTTTTQTNFNVPSGSKIFSYTKDSSTPKTLNIDVTSGEETVTYQLIVAGDFSSNLSSFLQAVQESY